MRRGMWVLSIVLSLAVVLSGCGLMGKKDSSSVVKELDRVVSKLDSYHAVGSMQLQTGLEPQAYAVEVSFQAPHYYRISLTNEKKDITQIVLRNDDGVFVLTPHLNKSFRFQSDWPENQGQVYLYQSLIQSILMDNDRQFTTDKDAYVYDVLANYQNGSLARQKIWLNKKDLAPSHIEVSDSNSNVMVIVDFKQFEFGKKFEKDSFDMQRNMTSFNLKSLPTMATGAADPGAAKTDTASQATGGAAAGPSGGAPAGAGTGAAGSAPATGAPAAGGTKAPAAASPTSAQPGATGAATPPQGAPAAAPGGTGAAQPGSGATSGAAKPDAAASGTSASGTTAGTGAPAAGSSSSAATKSPVSSAAGATGTTAAPAAAGSAAAQSGAAKQLQFGVIVPNYLPAGVKQQDIRDMKLGEEQAVLIRYSGKFNYSLVESKPQTQTVTSLPGDILDLGFTLGVVTGDTLKSLTWTYDGMEFRLSTADLPETEMIKVAQAVQGQSMK